MTKRTNLHEVEIISITFAPSKIQSSVKTRAVVMAMATQRLFSNGWNIFHHDTYMAKRAPLDDYQGVRLIITYRVIAYFLCCKPLGLTAACGRRLNVSS